MALSEAALQVAAVAFEVGVFVVAVVCTVTRTFRQAATLVLGATTPWIALYAFMGASHFAIAGDHDRGFAVNAMWLMTAVPYVSTVLVAVGLSFVPSPKSLMWRFGLGVLCAPLGYAILLLGATILDPN